LLNTKLISTNLEKPEHYSVNLRFLEKEYSFTTLLTQFWKNFNTHDTCVLQ